MARPRPEGQLCELCLRCHRRLLVPCGIAHRVGQPPRPTKPCTKCGALHRRKAGWCKDCFRAWADARYAQPEFVAVRERERTGRVGEPPRPPPGFMPSDLATGRPVM